MDFEELLKKKSGFCRALYIGTERHNIPIIEQPAILLKDLGEWAWVDFLESNTWEDSRDFTGEFEDWLKKGKTYNVHNLGFYDVAIACLGKEEVKKRLKAVSKK